MKIIFGPVLSISKKDIGFGRVPGFVCSSDKSDIWMKMGAAHWWNDNGKGKPKYSEGNLPKCHFAHHKCHLNWPGIGSEPPR
jgi:hypothetical protein